MNPPQQQRGKQSKKRKQCASTHPALAHPSASHPAASHPEPTHPAPSHPTPTHPAPSHPIPFHPSPSHPAHETNLQEVTPQDTGFEEATSMSSGTKRRGRSYGKRLHELIEANDGKPLTVSFDPKLKVPINKVVHTLLTNEIGTSIRTHAPVCHKLWEKVPDDDKKKQIVNLLALFDVDLTQSMVSEFVEAKMARAYIVFKNRLHDHYKKVATTPARGRATLPLDSLWNKRPVEHWHWLCDKIYTEPTFVEKSKKNSDNRKKNKTNHRGGACSFVQHAQQAVKEGKPLSFIDNWERLYKDKEHNWISEDAQEKHEKMKQMRDELRSKMIEEADEDIEADSMEVPIEAEFKIMGDVLGVKGRTVRGLGAFPRMETNISTTSFSGASNSELRKLQDTVQMLATNMQSVQEEYSNLRANLVAALEASNNGGLDNAQLMSMLRAALMPSTTT